MELLKNSYKYFFHNSIFVFWMCLSPLTQAQVCTLPASLQYKDTVQVSVFFGYIDQRPDSYVLDPKHSQDLLSRMMGPCQTSRDVVCGFLLTQSHEKNRFILEKFYKGKTFQIQIISSALSEDDNLNSQSSEQLQISSRNFELFNQALLYQDVVLYQGHSRYGYGPDFLNPVLDDQGHVLKDYYDSADFKTKSMVASGLQERSSQLPVLGMFSCDSDRHFSKLFRASQKTDFLMLTNDITYSSQLQKPMLQFLHNLLVGQCLSQGILGFRFY